MYAELHMGIYIYIWTFDTESNIFMSFKGESAMFLFLGGNPLVVRLHVREAGIIMDCGSNSGSSD